TVVPTIGQKIPMNRKQIIEEIVALRSLVPPVISMTTVHRLLTNMGMKLEDNEAALIQAEQEGLLTGSSAEEDETEEARRGEEVGAGAE
ncbi:MAG: hypothetical protein ACRDQB_10120, partial [Thermocrispum sp.]